MLSGLASSSNAAGTSWRPTSPVIIGATSMAPSAIELQAAGELLGRVAEHELQVELLGDAEHRRHRVGLHAHADDDDAALRRRHADQLVDHAGHADGLEHGHLAIAATRDQAANGVSSRGSTTSWAPIVTASAGGRGEVGGHDRGHAEQPQGGDHGQADGTAPDDDGAVAGLEPERFTACSPTAIGSVSAACVGASPLGTCSVAVPTAASARCSRTAGGWCRRGPGCPRGDHGRHRRDEVPGAGPSVPGPTSRTGPQNSWPMNTSWPRSVGVRPGRACPRCARRPPSSPGRGGRSGGRCRRCHRRRPR